MVKYGEFEEKGYTVTACMPSHGKEPQEWHVTFAKQGVVVREERIPMLHAPVFGPDVADTATLEEVTDGILAELP